MTDKAIEKARWKCKREAWRGVELQARLQFEKAPISVRRRIALDWFEIVIILRTEAKRAQVWDFYNRYYARWHARLVDSIFSPEAPATRRRRYV